MTIDRRISSISMEAAMFQGSPDQSMYLYKSHISSNPKRIIHPFIPKLSDNFQHKMGILQAPQPFLSHSYPPYSVQQPPLLPLPTANPCRGVPCSPANRRTNTIDRARDHSLNPKKSKSPTKNPKKEGKSSPKRISQGFIVSSTSTVYNKNANHSDFSTNGAVENQVDLFSGSVAFSKISPPPSSLPLPTFSLRPKLSCKAQAAGIDVGATNGLRRLLRIH